MIFSSLKIMIIFHDTSADFVLMSADVYFLAFEGHLSQKKISSHEIIIFELKNDGKKWSGIYFEIHRAPSEFLLPSAKISAKNDQIGLPA